MYVRTQAVGPLFYLATVGWYVLSHFASESKAKLNDRTLSMN
jgi:hypothetical protein